jgi:speckle-type POZ protein
MAAAVMAAAARRLPRSTASTMVLREVSGSHKLTIDGVRPSKNLCSSGRSGWSWFSKTFDVGDRSWRINYSPKRDNISLHLELDPHANKDAKAGAVQFKFSLLDQSGNPVPKFTRATTGYCAFDGPSTFHGFDNFITWSDLEESGCLKDDRFAVRCDVIVTTGSNHRDDDDAAASASIAVAAVPAPSDDVHESLADILWKQKRGADVTIDVGGEVTFDAHGWLLAARSPVLEAELAAAAAAAAKEKKSTAGGAHHRRIEIQGVDPKVFKAVLHYMYTDALPAETATDDAMAMAQGLLAAADRFKLDRLKLLCEETLSRSINVGTAAGTLAVAEQHGCGALKAACLEFMARPGNLVAVMDTEGFEKAKEVIAKVVMTEVFMKQAARFI